MRIQLQQGGEPLVAAARPYLIDSVRHTNGVAFVEHAGEQHDGGLQFFPGDLCMGDGELTMLMEFLGRIKAQLGTLNK